MNRLDYVQTTTFSGGLRAIAPIPGTKKVWCGEKKGLVTVRHYLTGEVLSTPPYRTRPPKQITAAVYVQETGCVWVGHHDGQCDEFREPSREHRHRFTLHVGAVNAMIESEGFVFTGGADWKVMQWETTTRKLVRAYAVHNNAVRCLARGTMERSTYLYSGGDDGAVLCWNIRPIQDQEEPLLLQETVPSHSEPGKMLPAEPFPVTACFYNFPYLWCGYQQGTVRVFDTLAASCARSNHDCHSNSIVHVGMTSDTILITICREAAMTLWDVETLVVLGCVKPTTPLTAGLTSPRTPGPSTPLAGGASPSPISPKVGFTSPTRTESNSPSASFRRTTSGLVTSQFDRTPVKRRTDMSDLMVFSASVLTHTTRVVWNIMGDSNVRVLQLPSAASLALEGLQQRINVQNEDVERYKTENDVLVYENERLASDNADRVTVAQLAQQELKGLKDQLYDLQMRCDDRSEELIEITMHNTKLQNELDTALDDLVEAKEQLDAERRAKESVMVQQGDWDAERSRYQERLEAAETETRTRERSVQEAAEGVARHAVVESWWSGLVVLQNEWHNATTSLERSTALSGSIVLRSEIDVKDHELREIQDRYVSLEQEAAELRNKVDSLERTNAALEQSNRASRKDLSEAQAACGDTQKELENLRQQADNERSALEKSLEEVNAALRDATSEVETTKRLLLTRDDELKRTAEEVEHLKATLRAAEASSARVMDDVAANNESLEELKRRCESLQEQLRLERQRTEAADNRVKKIQEEKHELEEDLQRLNSARAELDAALKDSRQSNDKLTSATKELKGEIVKEIRRAKELDGVVRGLQDALAEFSTFTESAFVGFDARGRSMVVDEESVARMGLLVEARLNEALFTSAGHHSNVAHLTAQLGTVQHENQQLSSDLETMTALEATKSRELQELTRVVEKLESELEAANVTNRKLETETLDASSRWESERNELKEVVSTLQEQLNDASSAGGAATAQTKELRRTIAELEKGAFDHEESYGRLVIQMDAVRVLSVALRQHLVEASNSGFSDAAASKRAFVEFQEEAHTVQEQLRDDVEGLKDMLRTTEEQLKAAQSVADGAAKLRRGSRVEELHNSDDESDAVSSRQSPAPMTLDPPQRSVSVDEQKKLEQHITELQGGLDEKSAVIDRLTYALAQSEGERDAATTSADELRNKLDNLRSELENQRSEISTLRQRLSATGKDVELLNEENTALKSKLSDLERGNSTLRQELDNQQATADDTIRELNSSMAMVASERDSHQERLESSSASFKDELQSTKAENARLAEAVDAAKRTISDLESAMRAANEKYQTLEEEKSAMEATNRNELQSAKAENARLAEAVDAAKRTISDLESAMRAANEKYQTLEEEKSAMEATNRDELQSAKAENARLAEAVDDAKRTISDLESAMRAANEKCQTLEQEKSAMEATIAEQQTRVEEAEQSRKSVALELERLQGDSTATQDEVQKELNKQRAAVQQAKGSLVEERQRNDELGQKLKDMEARLDAHQRDMAAIRVKLQAKEKELSDAKGLIASQTETLTRLKADKERLEKSSSGEAGGRKGSFWKFGSGSGTPPLQGAQQSAAQAEIIKKQEEALKEKGSALDAATKEVAELKSTMASLEAECAESRDRAQALQDEIERLQQELSDLQQQQQQEVVVEEDAASSREVHTSRHLQATPAPAVVEEAHEVSFHTAMGDDEVASDGALGGESLAYPGGGETPCSHDQRKHDALEQRVAELDGELAALKAEREKWQAEKDELELEVQRQRTQADHRKSQLSVEAAQLVTAQEKLAEQGEQLHTALRQSANATGLLREAEKQDQQKAVTIARLEGELDALNVRLDGVKRSKDTLQQELDEMRKEAAQRDTQRQTTIRYIEDELDDAVKRLQASREAFDQLNDEVRALAAKQSDGAATEKEMASEVQRCKSDLADREADIAELRDKLFVQSHELGNKMEDLVVEFEQLKLKEQAAASEIDALQAELASERATVTELRDALSGMQQHRDAAEKDLQYAGHELIDLRRELADTQRELTSAEETLVYQTAETARLEREFGQARSDGESTLQHSKANQVHLEESQAELLDAKRALAKATGREQELERGMKRLEADVDRFKSLADEYGRNSLDAKRSIAQLQRSEADLKEQLALVQRREDESGRQSAQHRDKLIQQRDAVMDLERQLGSVKVELEAAERQARRIEDDLRKANVSLSEKDIELSRLRQEVDAERARADKLQKAVLDTETVGRRSHEDAMNKCRELEESNRKLRAELDDKHDNLLEANRSMTLAGAELDRVRDGHEKTLSEERARVEALRGQLATVEGEAATAARLREQLDFEVKKAADLQNVLDGAVERNSDLERRLAAAEDLVKNLNNELESSASAIKDNSRNMDEMHIAYAAKVDEQLQVAEDLAAQSERLGERNTLLQDELYLMGMELMGVYEALGRADLQAEWLDGTKEPLFRERQLLCEAIGDHHGRNLRAVADIEELNRSVSSLSMKLEEEGARGAELNRSMSQVSASHTTAQRALEKREADLAAAEKSKATLAAESEDVQRQLTALQATHRKLQAQHEKDTKRLNEELRDALDIAQRRDNDLKTAQSQTADSNKRLKEASERCADLENDIAAGEAALATAKQTLQTRQQEIQQLNAELESTQHNATRYEGELSDAKSALRRAENTHAAEKREMKEDIEQLAADLEAKTTELRGAGKRNQDLTGRLSAATQNVADLEIEVADLKSAVASGKRQVEQRDRDLADVKERLGDAQNRLDDQERSLAESKAALRKAMADRERETKELRADMATLAETVERSDGELKKLRTTSGAKIDELVRALAEAEANCEGLRATVDGLEAAAVRRDAQLFAAKEATAADRETIRGLEDSVASSESTIADLQRKVAGQVRDLDASRIQLEQSNGLNSSLETTNKEKQAQISELSSKMATLQADNKNLQGQLEETVEKLRRTTDELNASVANLKAARERIAETEAKALAAEGEVTKHSKTIREMEADVATLGRSMQTAAEEHTGAKAEWEGRHQSVAQQLDAAETKLAALMSTAAEQDSLIKQLERSLAEAKHEGEVAATVRVGLERNLADLNQQIASDFKRQEAFRTSASVVCGATRGAVRDITAATIEWAEAKLEALSSCFLAAQAPFVDAFSKLMAEHSELTVNLTGTKKALLDSVAKVRAVSAAKESLEQNVATLKSDVAGWTERFGAQEQLLADVNGQLVTTKSQAEALEADVTRLSGELTDSQRDVSRQRMKTISLEQDLLLSDEEARRKLLSLYWGRDVAASETHYLQNAWATDTRERKAAFLKLEENHRGLALRMEQEVEGLQQKRASMSALLQQQLQDAMGDRTEALLRGHIPDDALVTEDPLEAELKQYHKENLGLRQQIIDIDQRHKQELQDLIKDVDTEKFAHEKTKADHEWKVRTLQSTIQALEKRLANFASASFRRSPVRSPSASHDGSSRHSSPGRGEHLPETPIQALERSLTSTPVDMAPQPVVTITSFSPESVVRSNSTVSLDFAKMTTAMQQAPDRGQSPDSITHSIDFGEMVEERGSPTPSRDLSPAPPAVAAVMEVRDRMEVLLATSTHRSILRDPEFEELLRQLDEGKARLLELEQLANTTADPVVKARYRREMNMLHEVLSGTPVDLPAGGQSARQQGKPDVVHRLSEKLREEKLQVSTLHRSRSARGQSPPPVAPPLDDVPVAASLSRDFSGIQQYEAPGSGDLETLPQLPELSSILGPQGSSSQLQTQRSSRTTPPARFSATAAANISVGGFDVSDITEELDFSSPERGVRRGSTLRDPSQASGASSASKWRLSTPEVRTTGASTPRLKPTSSAAKKSGWK